MKRLILMTIINLKTLLKTLLLCVAIVCSTCAVAQTYKVLRSGADISSNLIQHIRCDHNGIMWVCTDNGVNRLDAAKNRTIFAENGPSNSFTFGFEDSKGRHWFCGSDNVYLYDDRTELLTAIPSVNFNGESISGRSNSIVERKDGTILVCTSGHGVLRLEQQKNGNLQFRQYNIPGTEKSRPHFVYTIIEDEHGSLWMTSERGLQYINGRTIRQIECADKSKFRHFSFLVKSKDGFVWVGNHAGGVWRINPKTFQVDIVPALVNTPVECVVANHTKEILVGTNSQGLWQIDSNNLSVFQLNVQLGNITDNHLNVHALEDDSYGNLWVGCYQKGVVILPKIEERFKYIGRNSSNNSVIGNACVMSLGKDAEGRIWVAGDGDGLYMLHGDKTRHYAPSSSMPNTVMTQYCDSKGRLWLGTWVQGLWVMDTATGRARKVNLPVSGSSYSVFALREDAKGRLWIGTLGDGIFCLDLESGKMTNAPKAATGLEYKENLNVIPNNWINDFSLGSNGILYMATCDGVGAINTANNDCVSAFKGKNRLFAGINVNTVCYTKDNHLWVGTGNGLYCVDLKTLKSQLYQHEDGLLGNLVQSIIDLGDGTLWIGTNAGVSQLRISDRRIVNYSSHNGMYGNEFSRNAAIVGHHGEVWFGGTEGLTYFSPANLQHSAVNPRFFVTGLYVEGNYVTPSTESNGHQIIDRYIMNATEIELDYSDNSFTLEFSTLNYMRNDEVVYEYRIDNGQWQSLPPGTNTVSLTNMKPGTYKLMLRAMMQGKYSAERVIKLHIRSPWYATWWACLLYLLAIILVVYTIIYRIRQRQLNAINTLKLRQQEEMSEAKLQFFTNISHEIRTPMTLIISPLQRLIGTDADPDHQAAYHRMDRNAKRILQLVNQMLDVRKIDKGQMKLYFREVDMVSYVSSIVNGFADLCDTKHITISFATESSAATPSSCAVAPGATAESGASAPGAIASLKAWIDPMNFEKIIINLISNAFKYTPEGGSISVLLTQNADTYSIRVQDNGSGLNEDEISHIFERFYQLRNSTNRNGLSLNGEKHAIQGTGIGLNLTHSLVELHHGTISCANNGEGMPGCHFLVTMPLGRAHLKDSEIDKTPEDPASSAVAPGATAPELQPEPTNVKGSKPASSKSRKHILIVEDDVDINSYLSEELARDFHITSCHNGQEALNALRKSHKYDLVISDVMMPVMDGLELLRAIRQNTDLNNLPVILLTAKVTDKDNIDGLECGADAYITKPFNIEVVRITAKNLIQRHGQLRNIYKGAQNPEVTNKIKVMSPDEKLMQRIMKVVNAHLADPNLGNEVITREVGISRVHLYRKLKELTNLSLRDFIRNIRLNEAARLLGEQKHSVAEIAQKTGFENVSYFTVIFKQKYGVPPSQYHGQAAEKEEVDSDAKQEQ